MGCRPVRGAAFLVALFLFGAFLPALAASPAVGQSSGGVATPASFGVELVENFFLGTRVSFREIAWHPSGDYALVAGGARGPATDPAKGWTLLARYVNATGAIEPILNESGPMLFAVEFHPSGGHAIVVGEKDVILRYDHASGTVENIWATLVQDQVQEGKPPVFFARGLAYRPDGAYALITGSALLAYHDDVSRFYVRDDGEMKYFKAAAFAPDSSYAIVEGGDTDEEGRARIGQLWWIGLNHERCSRYERFYESVPEDVSWCMLKFALPYGLFEPHRSDPADITFHPVINASFVYGYDDTHGTIMRIRDNGTEYVPEWMQAHHKAGKYTDMEFRPGGTRALVTALGDPQLLEFDGLKVRTIMNATMCAEHFSVGKCPELTTVAWHPTGAYAVASGFFGGFVKILPKPDPEVVVTHPKPSETIVDKGATVVLVQGTALATAFGQRIEAVEVSVDGGAWEPANVTAKFNPANWRFRWNVSEVAPGPHAIAVRARDTAGHESQVVELTVHVALPPPPLDRPALDATNLTSVRGDFLFGWAPVEGAVSYEVQDSTDPDFVGAVTWPVDVTTFESLGRDAGTYHFRVRALGAPRPASEWSETLVVEVTEGRRKVEAPVEDPDAPSVDDALGGNVSEDDVESPDRDLDAPIDAPDTDPEVREDDRPQEPGTNPVPAAGVVAALAAAAAAVTLRRRR